MKPGATTIHVYVRDGGGVLHERHVPAVVDGNEETFVRQDLLRLAFGLAPKRNGFDPLLHVERTVADHGYIANETGPTMLVYRLADREEVLDLRDTYEEDRRQDRDRPPAPEDET